MNCPKCGKELEAGTRFCNGCGAEQVAAGSEAPPVETPAETIVAAPAATAPVGGPVPPVGDVPPAAPVQPIGEVPPAEPAQPIGEVPPAEPAQPPVYPPQQPPYQPAVAVPEGAAPAGDVPPRKKRGPLIAIGALVLALVILAVTLFVVLGKSNPKNTVANAYSKTFAAMGKEFDAYTPGDSFSAVSALLGDAAKYTTMEIGLRYEDYYEDFDFALGMDIHYDEKGRQSDIRAGFAMEGETLVDIDVALRDNLAIFGLPALLEGRYAIDAETFAADYNSSILRSILGLGPVDTDMELDFFNPLPSTSDEDGTGLVDAAGTALAMKNLWDTAETEKKGTQEEDVNGTTLSCDWYVTTITADAVYDFMTSLEAYMTTTDMVETLRSLRRELSGDWELHTFVHDGYAVKTELGTRTRSGTNIEFVFSHSSVQRVLSDMVLAVYIDGVGIAFEWDGKEDGSALDADIRMTALNYYGDEAVFLLGNLRMDPENQQENIFFTLAGVNEEDDEQMTYTLRGSIYGDTASKTAVLNLRNSFIMVDYWGDETKVDFDLLVEMGADDGYTYAAAGNYTMLLEMSMGELEDLVYELQYSLMMLMYML